MKQERSKVFHAARIQKGKGKIIYLLLRKEANERFTWFEDQGKEEEKTEVQAATIAAAVQLAAKHWEEQAFRTLRCGTRFELPERDEHGMYAFFHQMVDAYANSSGIYFDEDLGEEAKVEHASSEALELMRKLAGQNRLY